MYVNKLILYNSLDFRYVTTNSIILDSDRGGEDRKQLLSTRRMWWMMEGRREMPIAGSFSKVIWESRI